MRSIEISVKTLFAAAAIVLLYNLLTRIGDVFILIILAYIITAAIEPVVHMLTEKHIPRNLAIFFIYFTVSAILVGGGLLMIRPLGREISELLGQLPTLIDTRIFTNPTIRSMFNLSNSLTVPQMQVIVKNATTTLLQQNTGLSAIYKTVLGIGQGFASIASVIVMSIYMLIYKKENTAGLAHMVPERHRERFIDIFAKTEKKLGQWLRAQMLMSFIVAIAYFIILNLLHVHFALVLAILAGFMEVIPLAGPIIAGSLILIITFLLSPAVIIYVLIAAILIQETEAHILVPQIMKKAIGLNPLVTIISLLIGTTLLGVIGAVLSVPLAASLQILYLEVFQHD